MQIQVRINEEGALRNQRYAFTDRFTLVSELLQNARRAGAMQIEIGYDADAKILTVQDDGRGIGDFQTLLSFNESGWDAGTQTEEHPFGVGFSKCLYAATRCIVASHRQRADIDTAAALAKAFIDVETVAEHVAGTRIELHGVDLPDLADRIGALSQGFPVALRFNGKRLERPFALANIATMASAIGPVHLAGTRDGKHSHVTLVFLQGFCVMRPKYCCSTDASEVNIVHLDPRQFMARLPDRDRLIDEDLQAKRINAELKACWRRTLEIAKTRMSPERFVETYYPAMRNWGHQDLMNDLDVLPAALFEEIVAYPIQDDDHGYVRQAATAPTREAIESGAVTLVALGTMDDHNAAHWMVARAKGYLVFDWISLQREHWAWLHVRFLGQQAVRVDTVGEQHRVRLEGRWIWPLVILCERVVLQSGQDVVEITDAGVCHDGVLYIPAGEASGEPVRQVSSFVDENDRFLASDLEADRDALADLIRRLRAVDPVQMLDSLLRELGLGKYPLLRGKTFEVTVGNGSAPGHTVDLVVDHADAGSRHAGA
ncbi:sensor histidine kinase [Pseudothauera nasutitermitis]|uniref:Sensor histidine kinase n=1 Tax=Pseudothauera nasutitermitis TaxID=2565930 RepID=A0A4S4AXV9_9RHOO|nr:ATP-binding protein [Pseudothauera nasutitermitis]THF64963.1 sensor histidine kinase [Pseudothauera nasutitermitis]